MTELRKIETIAEPGNWVLLVSPKGKTALVRILDNDTVQMRSYEPGESIPLRLPRLTAFAEALSAHWLDGDESGLDEFRAH